MKFKRIKIQNIRSYEDVEINFPDGAVLLSGNIGSGKTTILLAIEFALFGLQPGQKGASLLRNTKDNGQVELELEINNQPVIITRTLKRKKSVTQESAFIEIDGKKQEKSITELKDQILRLLNYPLEFTKKTNLLYRYTVYTPQENMKQIILENPDTRLNTIRHIFGIDKYKRIKENTVILTAKLREGLRLMQGQILDLDELKQKVKDKKEFFKDFQKQVPEIEKNIKNISEKTDEKQKEIQEIQEKIQEKTKLENEVEKTNLMLTTKQQQLSKCEKEIQELKNKLEQASKDFNQEQLDELTKILDEKKQSNQTQKNQIIELSTKINTISLKKQELESLKQNLLHLTTCPTCLQQVSDDHKMNILNQTEKQILETNNQKVEFNTEKNKLESQIRNLDIEVESLEDQKSKLETLKIKLSTIEQDKEKHQELEKQKNSDEKDIELLSEQINRLKQSILSLKKFENIMLTKQRELEEITNNQKQTEIKRAEIIKEIELGKQEINNLKIEVEKKQQIKDKRLYNSELENWLSTSFLEMISTIEKNVMIKLREEFSTLFSKWFSILVPDVFNIKIDDDFTPIIEQRGFELDYNFLSGGERTAVALAYRLALNQTINSVISEIKTKGIVILDEPTDGFSQQQLDKMRDVLQQLNVEQLILVSHDQKIESFVDNIIKLGRFNGVSKVV